MTLRYFQRAGKLTLAEHKNMTLFETRMHKNTRNVTGVSRHRNFDKLQSHRERHNLISSSFCLTCWHFDGKLSYKPCSLLFCSNHEHDNNSLGLDKNNLIVENLIFLGKNRV